MKALKSGVLFVALLAITSAVQAQPARNESAAASRYFQITLNLKFMQVADQPPATETITTQVAVREGKPGSCKARMLSQVPMGAGSTMKYLELGTKLDCNDVRVEGDGIALKFALETSGLTGTAKTRGADGVIFEEPLITQRSVELSVKLPLDHPKVVFDASTQPSKPLSPLPTDGPGVVSVNSVPARISAPMVIEITATELR
jgi:hypothetical protein